MSASSSAQDLSSLEQDPRLFLYTSLTAGSSHIITATSRLETILKANKIPFLAIDIATDEKARRLWQRRAGKRKLPGLVKEGFVLGDLDEVEEWNEFEELKENLGTCPPVGQATNLTRPPQPTSAAIPLPVRTTATQDTSAISKPSSTSDENQPRPLPGATEIASRARNKQQPSTLDPPAVETMTSAPKEKETSITFAATETGDRGDHLSAPASAIPSGTTSPVSAGIKPAEDKRLKDMNEHLSAPPSGAATPAGVDHLSAPPSGVQTPAKAREEGMTSAAAQVSAVRNLKAEEGVVEEREEHLSAPPSGVQTPLGGEGEGKGVTLPVGDGKGVEGSQTVGAEGVQAQEAGRGEEAGKSVED